MNETLEDIKKEIAACEKCALCNDRKNTARKYTVAGEGVLNPLVLVVGEAPGMVEEVSGRPFVGYSGQLLDKMLLSIGLSRETNCFITNIVKCRPPENRDPAPEEINACIPFLHRQIKLLSPLLILSMGRISSSILLQTNSGITSLRGRWGSYEGIPVMPTFHPAYLLRDEKQKDIVWEDLKLVGEKLCALDKSYEAAEKKESKTRREI